MKCPEEESINQWRIDLYQSNTVVTDDDVDYARRQFDARVDAIKALETKADQQIKQTGTITLALIALQKTIAFELALIVPSLACFFVSTLFLLAMKLSADFPLEPTFRDFFDQRRDRRKAGLVGSLHLISHRLDKIAENLAKHNDRAVRFAIVGVVLTSLLLMSGNIK